MFTSQRNCIYSEAQAAQEAKTAYLANMTNSAKIAIAPETPKEFASPYSMEFITIKTL